MATEKKPKNLLVQAAQEAGQRRRAAVRTRGHRGPRCACGATEDLFYVSVRAQGVSGPWGQWCEACRKTHPSRMDGCACLCHEASAPGWTPLDAEAIRRAQLAKGQWMCGGCAQRSFSL